MSKTMCVYSRRIHEHKEGLVDSSMKRYNRSKLVSYEVGGGSEGVRR